MSAAKKGGDLTPAVFTYGDTQQVRTLVVKNQPWFVAKDLCGILGLSNSRKAMTGLDEDEVMVSAVLTSDVADVTNGYTRVQRRNMQLVNESGLYNLIFRSRKAEAKVFRRWVTGTVLPSIRRTGGYQKPATRRPSPMQPRATRGGACGAEAVHLADRPPILGCATPALRSHRLYARRSAHGGAAGPRLVQRAGPALRHRHHAPPAAERRAPPRVGEQAPHQALRHVRLRLVRGRYRPAHAHGGAWLPHWPAHP
ncbi:MAG: hypothetical protein IPO60_09780 [Flavobacteriales bacterium]|nr:hypothetical protein [Flavobacteriales bacterium]